MAKDLPINEQLYADLEAEAKKQDVTVYELVTRMIQEKVKEDMVEVTVFVPQLLLHMVEKENYFGYDSTYFWEAAIKSLVGSELSEKEYDEEKRIREKYGIDLSF